MHKKRDVYLLRFILIVFKISLIAPFTMKICKHYHIKTIKFFYSANGSIYSMVLSLITLFLNYCPIIYNPLSGASYDDGRNFLQAVSNIIIIVSGDTAYRLIVFMYCFEQKTIVNIANRLINLHYNLLTHLDRFPQLKGLKVKKYFVILVLLMHILQYIGFIIFTIMYSVEITFPIGPIITEFTIGCVAIQYTLVLNYLKCQFYILNEALLFLINSNQIELQENINFVLTETLSNTIKKDLFVIRNARRILFEISSQISDVYGWSILLTITFMCIKLIHSSYIIMSELIYEIEGSKANFFMVIWIIKDFFPIIVLATYGIKITEETKRTGEIIHKILATNLPDIVSIKYALQQFSMELLHQSEVSFTACRFFTIDGHLLKSIISTTITYMIILLQYKPKKEGKITNQQTENKAV